MHAQLVLVSSSRLFSTATMAFSGRPAVSSSRTDRIHLEVVASLSEQDHHAQAAHLVLVIEAVAAVLLANRVQQALLFPEMQGRDTHTHLFGRLTHSKPLRMGGARLRGGSSG